MSAYRQMPLAFDHRPALSGEDFLVAPGNAEAVAWIDRWPDWPMPALIAIGIIIISSPFAKASACQPRERMNLAILFADFEPRR